MKWFICAGLFIGGFSFLAAQSGDAGQTGPLPVSGAQIREITGRVELKAPNQETWVTASPGDYMEKDTLISTGFKSSAILSLGNSSLFVQALTRLSLGELSARGNEEKIDLSLRTGRVRAEVRPPPDGKIEFTVRSPMATASVRGTVFEFDTMNLRVAEGRVDFTPVSAGTGAISPKAVPVTSGESSFIDTLTGSAVTPAAISTSNLSPPPPAGTGVSLVPAETPISTAPARLPGSVTITVDLKEKGK
jgi:hypothetical protein